ncbi:glycosyltransferase [Planctobacterium marinum]|uniref:Glycosyltransferase subfamily 4-like N-terminal domain-containing protein n=1 Tax=Planctobacterium marinum TaxID=1631968 RepID=A0AA48HIS7_9ALTE|nr:hypothetical protein MACH26_31940 [Planctobacterium marinum]
MNIAILGRGDYSLVNRRVDSLRYKGHRVFFISLQKHTKEHDDNLYIKPMAKGLVGYLFAIPKVVWLLKALSYKAVDFHGASSYALFSLFLRRKFIISIYGPDVYDHALRNRLIKKMINFTLKRAHTLSCSTKSVFEYLKPFKGLQNCKYAVVPYGINPIVDYDERRRSFREKLCIGSETRVYFHCRRFMQFWRVDVIAQAFSELKEKDVRMLFLFPETTSREKLLLDKVKMELDELGLMDKVIFIDGLGYDEYLSAQCASDVFISVGENDLLANSVLEGCLCRNVMILNRQDSYVDAFPSDNIVWIEKGLENKENIVKAMLEVLVSDSKKEDMIQANASYIKEHYLEAICTDKLITEYDNL